MRPLLLALLLTAAPAAAQNGHAGHAGHAGVDGRVGTVAFPNSASSEAQAPFLQGIALLHSFEYEDAADAFRAAREADPDFALAYWFEALTHHHGLWRQQDADAAREVLAELGATPAERLARTPEHERPWGEAVETLFVDEGTEEGIARAFAEAMRAFAAARPADPEVAAVASVAIQGDAYLRPPDEHDALLDEAASLAQRVYDANPDHPGAAHYLIHAFDTPMRAGRGVEAARAYAAIAPAAQHALHMPSHIFFQLGLWDDAVASNEAAWAASRNWVRRRGADASEHDFHSLTWLQYVYLQQGRLREALALVDTARTILAASAEGRTQPIAALGYQYATHTGQWDTYPRDAEPTSPSTDAWWYGLVAFRMASAEALAGDTSTAPARAVRVRAEGMDPGNDREGEVTRALYLEALAARAAGADDRAIDQLRQAAERSWRVAPSGPPGATPPAEMLGDALLAAGRPGEALEAYEGELARRHGRASALLGVARARRAMGDGASAVSAYRQLLANWHRADADHPDLEEVRRNANSAVDR